MLQDIYNQTQRKINTQKFLALPINRQKSLLDELYKTIIVGLRHLVISNVVKGKKKNLEKIIEQKNDDQLFVFGRQNISDFDNKLQYMIDKVTLAFTNDINQGSS